MYLFPDRYIILGGHRDSWVFGGIDPTTGAAVLQEVVRSFGKMKMEGKSLIRDIKCWIRKTAALKNCVECSHKQLC